MILSSASETSSVPGRAIIVPRNDGIAAGVQQGIIDRDRFARLDLDGPVDERRFVDHRRQQFGKSYPLVGKGAVLPRPKIK